MKTTRCMKIITILTLVVPWLTADTIYQDDFSGLGSDPLNGTAPDIRPGSEVWDARQSTPLNTRDFRADGSFAAGGRGSFSASLPVPMETGYIYTFSIDLKLTNPVSGSTGQPTHWAGISLTDHSQMRLAVAANMAMLILRRNGAAQASVTGETVKRFSIAKGTYANTQQLVMTVNTALLPWTVGLRIGGASIGTSHLAPGASVPRTNYISIGQFGTAGGTFDNLRVSVEKAGTVLYHDNFDGLKTEALDGAAPDVRPASEVWVARKLDPLNRRDPRADGSMIGGKMGNVSGSLPVNLENGKIYSLTADVKILNPLDDESDDASHWAALALAKSIQKENPISDDFASILIRRNGSLQAHPLLEGGAIDAKVTGAVRQLEIVLTTTETPWTVEYKYDGVSMGKRSAALAVKPGVYYVSIGQQNSMSIDFDRLVLRDISE